MAGECRGPGLNRRRVEISPAQSPFFYLVLVSSDSSDISCIFVDRANLNLQKNHLKHLMDTISITNSQNNSASGFSETKIALLSAVVIPIAVTILAIVVPKLIEKYLQ